MSKWPWHMDDDFWSIEDVAHLHQQVRGELQRLFQYYEGTSSALFRDWLHQNPQFSPDIISHQGPFDVALRVHYTFAEHGDHTSMAYIDWRRSFNAIWEDGRKLTPLQESILRSRGWDGS